MQGELCWVNVVVNTISRGCREVVNYPPAAVLLGNNPQARATEIGKGGRGTGQPFDRPRTPPGTR